MYKNKLLLMLICSINLVHAEENNSNKYLNPNLGGWFFNTYDKKPTQPEKNYPERREEGNKYQRAERLIQESIPNEIVRQQQMQLEFVKKQKETQIAKEPEIMEESDSSGQEQSGHWLNTK